MSKTNKIQTKLSLHERIRTDIQGRIVSGEWLPGYRIPYEHELTEEYNCSRMTVNKALTELSRTGMIERRRKSGSFVSRPQSESAVLEIQKIKDEVESLGLPYRFERINRRKRKITKRDRDLLKLVSGAKILEISCLHFAGAAPFCLEERIINLESVPEAADESFQEVSPGLWLLNKIPWSAGEHRIYSTNGIKEVCDQLLIPEGSACLVIERTTWNAECPITHANITYPGSNHAIVARFSPPGT